MSPRELVEHYREALRKSLRAAAEVERLDEQRRIVRARLIAADGGPFAKAEQNAMASTAYQEAHTLLSDARMVAADAKAEADYLLKRWETWRTRGVNARMQERNDE